MNITKIAFTFFLLCVYSSANADLREDPSIKGQEPIVLGQSYTLKNGDLKPIEINIYLPDSYYVNGASIGTAGKGSDVRYPVLYVVDGGKAQDFKHIAGLGALASINPYIFNELIIVGIATDNRLFQLTSLNTDKRYDRAEGELGGADEFRANIKNVIQPFIESKFRASSKKIVIGESLAGLFISETFLKTPNLFTDYIAISPSLWYDDRQLAKQASKLLKAHNKETRNLYLTMANEGGTMQKGLDEVLDAINKADLPNLTTNYVDRRQNEFHWTLYHEAALDALRWILPAPAPAYIGQEDPWYLVEGANPPGWSEN